MEGDVERARRCIESLAGEWMLCYAVLYGSRAVGRPSPHSDYDIAVRLLRDLNLPERGLLLGDLEKCLGARVDLLILDDWDPIAAWEALTKGELVYARDEGCLKLYYRDKARAIVEVADLEPLLRLFRRELRSALARHHGQA
jgi:predicted nucleotidyltransferase